MLPTLRSLAISSSLCLGLVATPALADPGMTRADGWVSEGGRILHTGEARPAAYAVNPATAGDWVTECGNRLAAANTFRPQAAAAYDSACRAWLQYYEAIGATRQGYGFAYAIPVAVSTVEVPGICPPPPPPTVRRKPAPRRPVVHDKRIRL